MTTKTAGVDLVSAQLYATWSMLIERGVLRQRDIDTIKASARDRLRHNVHGDHTDPLDLIDSLVRTMRSAC